MNMRNRIFAMVMALVMLVGMFPVAALAEGCDHRRASENGDGTHSTATRCDQCGEALEQFIDDSSDFVRHGKLTKIVIDDIVPADARQPITVTIYNADGSEYSHIVTSIECYVATAIEHGLGELYPNIMRFADSAYAYLHRNDAK